MTICKVSRASLKRAAATVCSCTLSGVLLCGCKPPAPPPAQQADYAQTLNKYYEGRPMCLWQEPVKFPVEAAAPDEAAELGLAGLVNAGLLVAKPAVKGSPKGSKTYDLTPEGRSALDPDVFNQGAGNFCYGRRKVTSVDAARRNSSTTELVDYHYALAQPASWATENSVQNAFPQVATELSGPHLGEATLLDTVDGWQISGTPAMITPRPQRSHPSVLAKAVSTLHIRKKNVGATP